MNISLDYDGYFPDRGWTVWNIVEQLAIDGLHVQVTLLTASKASIPLRRCWTLFLLIVYSINVVMLVAPVSSPSRLCFVLLLGRLARAVLRLLERQHDELETENKAFAPCRSRLVELQI